MSTLPRRSFLFQAGGAGLAAACSGSFASMLLTGTAQAARSSGYGPLVPDPNGVLDLPRGFQYRILSRAAIDHLDGGQPVPGLHDGMAAFHGDAGRTILVRNHEVAGEDVAEDGVVPVPHVSGHVYDPNAVGGTTTLVVGANRQLVSHHASLAGTSTNCAGGPTPWRSWLTCEETDETIDGVKHGYVFEVDPSQGGNPVPIKAMGRFEHEAVSFDHRTGVAYLTEDADGPNGLFYRFRPAAPLGGLGSLHAGGELAVLRIPELGDADLSAVTAAGTVFTDLEWLPVADPDPEDAALRELYPGTRIPKGEGTWYGSDGAIWLVSSRGDGPDAEDEDERSSGVHGGQIWRYDPVAESLRLVVRFSQDHDFEGPDNITVSPYGFAVMCTDGEDDDQFLAGITPDGAAFPLAFNRLSNDEFAGACFDADGKTLYANIQDPGLTLAIWGPWRSLGH
jgi:uncharacterized protein